jgi:CBS domain-containing protein
MRVQDVMTADVITVGPDVPVHKAARLMSDHGVSGLPVVDADGLLIGIVTEGDRAHGAGGSGSSPIPTRSRVTTRRPPARPSVPS